MFQSEAKLPHLLAPACYCSESALAAEQCRVFQEGWHIVGDISELAQDGSFLTFEVAGKPVHVRNFSGTIRALSNVCAHRHALITSEAKGNSMSMRCQYHGWEYQADGTTGKIPRPKNFVPFDRECLRLPVYHVELLGQLVFVSVSQSPRPLREYLGEKFACLLEDRFSDRWQLGFRWRPHIAVNWKVPVENSLESYHVPAVHANTFRCDPGNERTEHVLADRYTNMSTGLPFSPHTRSTGCFSRWSHDLYGC